MLTARNTGLSLRLRMRATSSSSSVTPVFESTRNTTVSASWIAMTACSRILPWKASSEAPTSMPPVSHSMKGTPFQSDS